jgi:hypothetical protein
MVRALGSKAPTRIRVALIAFVAAGCGKAPPRPCGLQGMKCESPSSWEVRSGSEPNTYSLVLRHDDESLGLHYPEIHISTQEEAIDRRTLERERRGDMKRYSGAESFAVTEIKDLSIGDAKAWSYQMLAPRGDLTFHMHADRKSITLPYREETVLIQGRKRHYRVIYGAPEKLFAAHRPDFERFLLSIKFEH